MSIVRFHLDDSAYTHTAQKTNEDARTQSPLKTAPSLSVTATQDGRSEAKKSDWVRFNGVINVNLKMLMERHVCVVQTADVNPFDAIPSPDTFHYGNGIFKFWQPETTKKAPKPRKDAQEISAEQREKGKQRKAQNEAAKTKTQEEREKEANDLKAKKAETKKRLAAKSDAAQKTALPLDSKTDQPHKPKEKKQTQGASLARRLMLSTPQPAVAVPEKKTVAPALTAETKKAEVLTYPSSQSMKENLELYHQLMKLQGIDQPKPIDPKSVIVNQRNNSFIPLTFDVGGQPSVLYTQLWTAKGRDAKERKSTAGQMTKPKILLHSICIGGSALTGTSQDATSPLIKHNVAQQKIHSVMYEPDCKIYELQSLDMFEHLVSMLKKASGEEARVHVPIQDYLLIAVQLFLRKNIDLTRPNLKPLNDACWHILEQGKELVRLLTEIGSAYGIKVKTGSPFEALFENIQNKLDEEVNKQREDNNYVGNYAHIILTELGVIDPTAQPSPKMDEKPSFRLDRTKKDSKDSPEIKLMPGTEHDFVVRWLERMIKTSEKHPVHSQVWQDFATIKDNEVWANLTFNPDPEKSTTENAQLRKTTIERCKDIRSAMFDVDSLFRVGNVVEKFIASFGMPEGSVLHAEEENERPIQFGVGHAQLAKEIADKYPKLFNLTCISSFQCHNAYNHGKSFYQPFHPKAHCLVFGLFSKVRSMILDNRLTRDQVKETFETGIAPSLSPKSSVGGR